MYNNLGFVEHVFSNQGHCGLVLLIRTLNLSTCWKL